MVRKSRSEQVPEKMRERFEAIVAITDAVCREHLNEEFAQLARQATAALCRKRPSPLQTGRANSWACGIVYALGFVNFMFDKSQAYYISATDLSAAFGVSASTGSARSRVVRDALGMYQMDPNWCLPSQMDDNPIAWMVMVNGLIVDVRSMPLEVQRIACEKGLIPYVPRGQEE